ncbi:MBL fold metallo-hydrolase [Desulfosarcina sp. OttesenSCG-928-A07]|nr:MBL fold metallo-hydrolase [Desulfosarcina sp. OttesenSCG-928-G17]MDL2328309.1 MBL fold metallo-hydrolase [Desulfosarcina sp. OttesenSCG-928-A07]
MGATILQIEPDLYLMGLNPPIPGFSNFIGSWLWKGAHGNCLVDVGPAVTADQLVDALSTLGADHLDYICLTHIHLDHAGAIGHLVHRFPGVPVVCHPKGIPHLMDPAQLWHGTVKTLGDVGKAYTAPLPVPPSAFATPDQLENAPFRVVDTPGHAPHHFSIQTDKYLFCGEAGGVCLSIDADTFYLRPATPPRFFLDATLASVDRLLALKPEILCYGHFGMRPNGVAMLTRHREQLIFWEETLMAEAGGKPMADVHDWKTWADLMLKRDPLLGAFEKLNADAQKRERGFLINSLKGFSGYLNEKAAS